MTLDDLTVSFQDLERESLLADWEWIIGRTKLPVLITASGDAFVQDTETGVVDWLDTASGTLTEIALSGEEFRTLLTDRKFVFGHFAAQLVGDLRKAGRVLEAGKIYSLIVPLVLGGDYVSANMEPVDIAAHFSITGQLHREIRDLPPGTVIGKVTID